MVSVADRRLHCPAAEGSGSVLPQPMHAVGCPSPRPDVYSWALSQAKLIVVVLLALVCVDGCKVSFLNPTD
jgi:hypothetical protein